MKALNVSALSSRLPISRPHCFNSGNTSQKGKHFCLSSSRVTNIWNDHRISSNSQKQQTLVLPSIFRVGSKGFDGFCGFDSQNEMFVGLRQNSCSRFSKSFRVKSKGSGGTPSGDSIMLDEQNLEMELQIAIKEENYARAAKIRDSIRHLQEDNKTSVLAANARFYKSFRNGDLATMQALWSKGDSVCVVHPGVSGISGYDLVMGSWEFVWAEYEFPLEIEIKDAEVHVRGDMGYVTCIEMVKTKGSSWGRQFATNVFEKIDGQWLMCVHHASYIDVS